MRAVLLGIAAVLLTCVACGGDGGDASEPLTLEQRLYLETEVPGSKPDPRETRLEASSIDEFMAFDEYAGATRVDSSKLEDAGFVSAIHDTRFFPETPEGAHTGDEPHVRMLVIRFGSDDGAQTGADLLHENALLPCPESCAQQIAEFDVSDVPDARGIRHFVTAENLEATGEPGDPRDSYTILFADGPFVYELEMFGPPGDVSQAAARGDRGKGARPRRGRTSTGDVATPRGALDA